MVIVILKTKQKKKKLEKVLLLERLKLYMEEEIIAHHLVYTVRVN